jgi:D-threo-aldose 1-dehydrogenase
MKRNRIGRTDVEVTDISFGTSAIGNLGRPVSEDEARAVLQQAWDNGIRYFDTAPHYGRGLAEQRLGTFLKPLDRGSFVVSTKVGRVLSPGGPITEADGFANPLPNTVRYDYSGDGIEASLESSLERLELRQVDIVYVHDIGPYTHGADNGTHISDLLGSGIDRLRRLKDRGKIRAFGLGVNETGVCLDLVGETDLDVILLAGRLTLLDRSAERRLVAECRRKSVSLVLGGIFNSGILATGPVEGAWFDYAPASEEILQKVRALKQKTEAAGVPLATAALHFARSHPAAASVLLGTARKSSLQRNLDALAEPVPALCRELF